MSEIFDAPFKIRQASRGVNVLLTSQVAINKAIIRATTAIVVTQLRARLLIKFRRVRKNSSGPAKFYAFGNSSKVCPNTCILSNI